MIPHEEGASGAGSSTEDEIMSASLEQGALGPERSYQDRVEQHFLFVAGDDHTDLPERRDRACEEFAELQQALGGTLEGWIAVGRYVWGRPIGEPAQEMGGTLNTLATLAAWAKLDMMACAEAELERTKRPEIVAKIRRKRANRHGRGPLPGDDADLITASAPASGAERMTAGQVAFAAFCNGPQAEQSWHAGPDAGRQPWERVAAAVLKHAALATPAPATPPGVPDSVRALLVEALAQHFHDEEHQHEGYAWVWPEYADDDGRRGNSGYVSITPPVVQMECREAAERITRRFEQFLATHPAGQSEPPVLRAVIEVHPERTDTRLTFGNRIRPEPSIKAVEQAIAALTAEYEARGGCPVVGRHPAGQSAGSGAAPIAVVQSLKDADWSGAPIGNKLLIVAAIDALEKLTAQLRERKPAPDSTRTGDEGTVLVPVEPTEGMWGGLARQIVMWCRGSRPTGANLHRDLKNCGWPIPDWLKDEIECADYVPPKGAVAVAIYRAMLAARPAAPEAQGAERVRHVKRGTEYEVLHRGVPLQVAVGTGCSPTGNCLHEGDRLVIYQGDDGKLWAREESEFDDGRFEPAPPSSSGQGRR